MVSADVGKRGFDKVKQRFARGFSEKPKGVPMRSKLRQALVCPPNERESSALRAFWVADSSLLANGATVRSLKIYMQTTRNS
jgi:hypothetical protein